MPYLKYYTAWVLYFLLDGPMPWGLLSVYKSRAAFRAAVQRYPEHIPPHLGFGRQITPEQAQANLDWFLASLPQRLERLDALLAEFGVPTNPAGDTLHDVEAWINQVMAWIYRCWPENPFLPEHKKIKARQKLQRVGDSAIFSMTLDLATKIGEVAIRMEPRWRWGLDMDKRSLKHRSLTARRIVLTTAPLGKRGKRVCTDWEGLVVSYYRKERRLDSVEDIPKDFIHDYLVEQLYRDCIGYYIGYYSGNGLWISWRSFRETPFHSSRRCHFRILEKFSLIDIPYFKYFRAWAKRLLMDAPNPRGLLSIYQSRAAFRAAVRRYPEHTPPHLGFGHQITPEQAQANLDWFLASLPQRLERLDALLAEFGVPTAPAGDTLHDVEAWASQVMAWIYRCWPEKPFLPEHEKIEARHKLQRVGDSAIFSITLDLATKMGEIAIRMEPLWRWELDMEKRSLKHQSLTARRIMLTTEPFDKQGVRLYADWEGFIVSEYRKERRFDSAKDIPKDFEYEELVRKLCADCASHYIKYYS